MTDFFGMAAVKIEAGPLTTPAKEQIMKKKPWEKTLRWRAVWQLGWFVKPLKKMWLDKVKRDGFDCLKNDDQW